MAETARMPDRCFLDAIRDGFAYVAHQARQVRIVESRLAAYALSLPVEAPANIYDSAHHFFGTPEETACATLILSALNFGSGYKEEMESEGFAIVDNSIYYAISTPLKNWFERERIVASSRLAAFSADDVAGILNLPRHGRASMMFATLGAQNLRELGQLIEASYGGSYLGFLDAMQGSAETLAATVGRLPSFHDVHAYRGRMIPIYKRAQITAGELQLAFERIGLTLFHDINRLTMYPDNGVPHVLRMDGVLDYAPELAARIDAGEEIPSGSEAEIELRCCAGHAVELLAAAKGMDAADIDYRLWHRSVEGALYQMRPAHRTKTVFY